MCIRDRWSSSRPVTRSMRASIFLPRRFSVFVMLSVYPDTRGLSRHPDNLYSVHDASSSTFPFPVRDVRRDRVTGSRAQQPSPRARDAGSLAVPCGSAGRFSRWCRLEPIKPPRRGSESRASAARAKRSLDAETGAARRKAREDSADEGGSDTAANEVSRKTVSPEADPLKPPARSKRFHVPNHRAAVASPDTLLAGSGCLDIAPSRLAGQPVRISGEEGRGAVPNRAGGYARIDGLDPQHQLVGDRLEPQITASASGRRPGHLWRPYNATGTSWGRTRPPLRRRSPTFRRRCCLPARTAASGRTKFIEDHPQAHRRVQRRPFRVPSPNDVSSR